MAAAAAIVVTAMVFIVMAGAVVCGNVLPARTTD
jgi:hypothetical protein